MCVRDRREKRGKCMFAMISHVALSLGKRTKARERERERERKRERD